jgi:hypothetical protein
MTDSKIAEESAAGWYSNAWTWRRAIWQNHQQLRSTEDLINFPALFDWTFPEFSKALPSGNDFLFTAADGITKLSHEVREWNNHTCRLRGYVKIPRLSPQRDTLIFLYYGNPIAEDQQDRAGVWKDYSYVGRPEKPAEHALRVLEALFKDPLLALLRQRTQGHPAVRWFDTLQRLTESLTFDFRAGLDPLVEVAAALLDCLDIREIDPSLTWELLAEPEAIRQIRTRLDDPDKFLDQYAVVRCWSLLSGIGLKARLVEYPGFPDICADLSNRELWVEVKRLRLGTHISRVRKVISKANKQLRNACSGYAGVIYLEVSLPIKVRDLSDPIPVEISNCIAEVSREFGSGQSCHAARVVLSWDEITILGQPPAFTMVVSRRRTICLNHPNPVSAPSIAIDSGFGRTVSFHVRGNQNEEAPHRQTP